MIKFITPDFIFAQIPCSFPDYVTKLETAKKEKNNFLVHHERKSKTKVVCDWQK